MSLIKCATDLILSGEGPAYVEKQLFRYRMSKDAETVITEPRIPDGMAAGHGKYILLRYSIAVLESEAGDDSSAKDANLYLSDLRRMREILLGSRPRIKPVTLVDAGESSAGDLL